MEFNENPFKKDTPVTPFSNGTDYEYWKSQNCDVCSQYECESKTIVEAKCKLAFNIDMGTITGTIPLWAAKEIGCKYDPLYGSCILHKECRKYNSDKPF